MSTGESHKFHLFKRPSKNESTYPPERCNQDATPASDHAPPHVRLSLPSEFRPPDITDKSAFPIGCESFGRKHSASCRRSLLRGSMASGAVRCRKTSKAKRRWNQLHRPCKQDSTP